MDSPPSPPQQPSASAVAVPNITAPHAVSGSNLSPTGAVTPSSPSKLRLMCSYGGHIVPRPHDKSLCYAGGETRIVAVDRRSALSFSALTGRLSRSIFSGRPFVLKYQLPNHDLDSLISISSDEDLSNMIDEYDRLTSYSSSPSSSSSRLRFFLFPVRPDPIANDYDARSESWFFDALKSASIATGKGGGGSRMSTDSSTGEGLGECEGKSAGVVDSVPGQGLGLGQESIVLETSSSFGSTGSAANSASNLTPIKAVCGEDVCGVPFQNVKANDTPVLDSVSSDGSSLASANLQSPTLVYLDSLVPTTDSKGAKVHPNLIDTESNASDFSPCADMLSPRNQVFGYPFSQPVEQLQQPPPTTLIQQTFAHPQPQPQPTLQPYTQHQYIHPGSNFVTQTQYYHPGAIQGAPYATTYQPSFLQQQQSPFQLNNPYQQVYVMPVRQAQAHDMSVPCNLTSQTKGLTPTRSHPMHTTPTMMVTSPVVYDGFSQAQSSAAERTTQRMYRAAQPVSSAGDEQHQFVAVSKLAQTAPVSPAQAQAQAQPVTIPSVIENSSYGMEYEDPMHAQIYKTQPPAPVMPSQYQPVMLSESLAQMQLENSHVSN